MPRVVAIENTLKAKDDVVGIKRPARRKPRRFLERDVAAQVETVGRAVIQHLPALCQLGYQTIGVGIYVQQTVVNLGRQGIYNQAAARFLRIEGVDLAVHAVDKTTLTNVSRSGTRRRGLDVSA